MFPKPPPEFEHGWQDESARFPTDRLLRRNGYTIHSRGKGEPWWRKGNTILRQSAAVEAVARQQKTR